MAPIGGIEGGVGGGLGLQLELIDKARGVKPADAASETTGTSDFAAVLKDKLTSLNSQQVDAGKASEDMATGRVDDVAQTMLRIEQAHVSLQMATQVRNKVIEAYTEILRMQM